MVKKTVLIFGTLVTAILLLFQFSKYSLMRGSVESEILLVGVALVFLTIGLFLRGKQEPKTAGKAGVDHRKITELQLSKREYEVLCEISNGLSNKEIGAKLHVSENTVKTHVSNLLIKLGAKRRTQAIAIAKELNIL